MKSHIEPTRQIKVADSFVQRHHFLQKSAHVQNVINTYYYGRSKFKIWDPPKFIL